MCPECESPRYKVAGMDSTYTILECRNCGHTFKQELRTERKRANAYKRQRNK